MPRPGFAALLVTAWAAAARAEPLDHAWDGLAWGEPAQTVARQVGSRATILPRPLDFGDSYVPLVVRDFTVGGVPLVVFYQMDKTTQTLKRIQLERPRHGVTPAAFRGVLGGLEADYGPPDRVCLTRAEPASGFQPASERIWNRAGIAIRAIFRATTLEALDGCFVPGSCGLTAQLLVRVSPPALDGGACTPPARATATAVPAQSRSKARH